MFLLFIAMSWLISAINYSAVKSNCLHTLQSFYSGAQEVCESRDGRPGLPVASSLYGLCGRKATLSDEFRAQELCENRGGRARLPVANSPYSLCGPKAAWNVNLKNRPEDGSNLGACALGCLVRVRLLPWIRRCRKSAL